MNNNRVVVNEDGGVVNGNYCTVNGKHTVVNGHHCIVNGNCAVVNGHHCTVNGENCIVNGNHCIIKKSSCIVNGSYCTKLFQREINSLANRLSNISIENVFDTDISSLNRYTDAVIRESNIIHNSIIEDREVEDISIISGSIIRNSIIGNGNIMISNSSIRDRPKNAISKKKDPTMLEYLAKIKDTETKDENKKCNICMTNERIIVFLECGHMQTCASCSAEIVKAEKPCCPFCKIKIEKVLKIFV